MTRIFWKDFTTILIYNNINKILWFESAYNYEIIETDTKSSKWLGANLSQCPVIHILYACRRICWHNMRWLACSQYYFIRPEATLFPFLLFNLNPHTRTPHSPHTRSPHSAHNSIHNVTYIVTLSCLTLLNRLRQLATGTLVQFNYFHRIVWTTKSVWVLF